MKHTAEVKPEISLDTKIAYNNDSIATEDKCNERNLPVDWPSKFAKRYKRNTIIGDLNRATGIVILSADEIPKIKQKFINTDYSHRFINSVKNNFREN